MVNTRQFSGSTYMQDMTKSHTFSAKNQGSTYTPIRLIRREIRYTKALFAWRERRSKNNSVCKNDNSKRRYGRCSLLVMGSWIRRFQAAKRGEITHL